jgi:hypothetical protein
MHDAVCGEFIARMTLARMTRTVLVQEPYEGCPVISQTRFAALDTGSGGCRSKLRGAADVSSGASEKRVRGERAKARSRLPLKALEGAKPKGASSGRRANPTPVARDSREGESPGTAARRAGPSLRRR